MTETTASAGRDCWQLLEGLHILAYFAPEPTAAYKELGLSYGAGYFAARSAPLGAVPHEVVTATFYVFNPGVVGHFIPKAWSVTTPEQVLGATFSAMGEVLGKALAAIEPAALAEALELARTACAGLSPQGRPLYAAWSSLAWPEDPALALWLAAGLLREHRGDGHMAALVTHQLDPVEAVVTYARTGGVEWFLKKTRGWSDEEWAGGVERCQTRGLLDVDGAVTAAGLDLRASVEATTDRLATAGWDHLGLDGCRRLRDLLAPFPAAMTSSGAIPQQVLDAIGVRPA